MSNRVLFREIDRLIDSAWEELAAERGGRLKAVDEDGTPWRVAVVDRALGKPRGAGDAAIAKALYLSRVDELDRRKRQPLPQPSGEQLPMLDELGEWMLGEDGGRVRSSAAVRADDEYDDLKEFEQVNAMQSAYARKRLLRAKYRPYLTARETTIKEAIEAYYRDHPEERPAVPDDEAAD